MMFYGHFCAQGRLNGPYVRLDDDVLRPLLCTRQAKWAVRATRSTRGAVKPTRNRFDLVYNFGAILG